MKQKLLDELMKVSEEEQKYLDGQGDIERQLYVKEKIEEIDRELLLGRDSLLQYVRIAVLSIFRNTDTIMWRLCMSSRAVLRIA